jgi:hypothetical protein
MLAVRRDSIVSEENIACIFRILISDPENGSDMFLRNVELSQNQKALQSRRPYSS